MNRRTGPTKLMAAAGCLGLITTVTWAIQVLPSEVSAVLFAWILASPPIGIVIGHCVLSEA